MVQPIFYLYEIDGVYFLKACR